MSAAYLHKGQDLTRSLTLNFHPLRLAVGPNRSARYSPKYVQLPLVTPSQNIEGCAATRRTNLQIQFVSGKSREDCDAANRLLLISIPNCTRRLAAMAPEGNSLSNTGIRWAPPSASLPNPFSCGCARNRISATPLSVGLVVKGAVLFMKPAKKLCG